MPTPTRWQHRSDEGNAALREELITEHLGLVHHVARQLSRSLALDADFDELVSCGTIGLMKALTSFDPSRGLAFSTFAAPRIRGAILDELRRQDHVPRSVRRKSRDLASARKQLMRTLGREPSDAELACEVGIDMTTYWRWQSETEGSVHVSLDAPTNPANQNSRSPMEGAFVQDEYGIEDILNHEQEVGILREAIMGLKEQERLVLSLYYYEELKLHQIAAILGVTESRVSQIRSKAVSRLRNQMSPLREGICA